MAARASVKFVSFEPLIGPVGRIDLSGIDWVIVGGGERPASACNGGGVGRWNCATSVASRMLRSSSNSGAAFDPNQVAGS